MPKIGGFWSSTGSFEPCCIVQTTTNLRVQNELFQKDSIGKPASSGLIALMSICVFVLVFLGTTAFFRFRIVVVSQKTASPKSTDRFPHLQFSTIPPQFFKDLEFGNLETYRVEIF